MPICVSLSASMPPIAESARAYLSAPPARHACTSCFRAAVCTTIAFALHRTLVGSTGRIETRSRFSSPASRSSASMSPCTIPTRVCLKVCRASVQQRFQSSHSRLLSPSCRHLLFDGFVTHCQTCLRQMYLRRPLGIDASGSIVLQWRQKRRPSRSGTGGSTAADISVLLVAVVYTE